MLLQLKRASVAEAEKRAMTKFSRARSGASSIEYALIATVIALVIVGAAGTIGGRASAMIGAAAAGFAAA